ncbi:MAG: hypothetical protein R2862_02025 [Thermoanaerobaculia bacterium]
MSSSATNCTASVSAKQSENLCCPDYKVLVLAVDEKYVSKTFQKQIAIATTSWNLEDATKITGVLERSEKRLNRPVEYRLAGRRGTHASRRRVSALYQRLKEIR